MPVAETHRIVPKSVLRHRPLEEETASPSVPAWTTTTPRASRTTQKKHKTRPAKCPKPFKKLRLPVRPSHRQAHWFVPAGLAVIATLLLITLAQMAGQGMTDISTNLRYGMPRTMQLDAVVGHHDSPANPTHLIGENLRGRIVIIEFPGGDVYHTRILVGPEIAGPNADQVPIMLTLVDRHGTHTPDLQIQFGSMEVWYVNRQGFFVAN